MEPVYTNPYSQSSLPGKSSDFGQFDWVWGLSPSALADLAQAIGSPLGQEGLNPAAIAAELMSMPYAGSKPGSGSSRGWNSWDLSKWQNQVPWGAAGGFTETLPGRSYGAPASSYEENRSNRNIEQRRQADQRDKTGAFSGSLGVSGMGTGQVGMKPVVRRLAPTRALTALSGLAKKMRRSFP